MSTPLDKKSSVKEIEKYFDDFVDRFSNLKTGQRSVVDAPLMMDLLVSAATRSTLNIRNVLDIGTGAGNLTIKLSQKAAPFNCDLIDLSQPMLHAAKKRVAQYNGGNIRTFHGDFRKLDLPENNYDVVLAAAVLHHLRDDQDWENVFKKIYRLTAPGGSVWISDLVSHETEPIQELFCEQYANFLISLGGESYQKQLFKKIDKEDSPRPLTYQIELLKKVGFDQVELLHKHTCFAAFGGLKTMK